MAAALKRGKCAAQAFVILICIILCFALACNLTFIVKGALSPERPPSVSGMTPMVVLSGSMSGQAEDSLEVGDLALIRRVEPDTLKVGDVVAYMSGGSAVTHRITAIETAEDGSLLFAGLPLAALLGWELLSRRRAAEAQRRERRELEAELRRMRSAAKPGPEPETFDLDDILSEKY